MREDKEFVCKGVGKVSKEATKNVNRQVQADKRLADKQRRETNKQARIDARRERASSIVMDNQQWEV